MRGKAPSSSLSVRRTEDHPRICGEKVLYALLMITGEGITPAYAGKRQRCANGGKCPEDHPRICGEKG